MKKLFIIFVLLAPFMLTGCLSKSTNDEKESPVTIERKAFSLEAFEDIDMAQLSDDFTVLGDTYKLVQQPSTNIVLDISENFVLGFVGVLKKQGDNKWAKIATIEDIYEEDASSPKNNPIALWEEKGTLRVAIVDQLGAGSGEGIFKIFVFNDNRIWRQESCGYYNPDKGDFLDPEGRLTFEYFQFNSIAKSYQSGPVFVKEVGEERMVNEPACDNVFVSSLAE